MQVRLMKAWFDRLRQRHRLIREMQAVLTASTQIFLSYNAVAPLDSVR
jgi:hypothetical protein